MVNVHLEKTLAGKRRVISWSAYPVTDNGQVLGTVGSLLEHTDRVQAARVQAATALARDEPTRRSGHSCSSAAALWSGICARCSPSWTAAPAASSTRP